MTHPEPALAAAAGIAEKCMGWKCDDHQSFHKPAVQNHPGLLTGPSPHPDLSAQ